MGSWLWRRSTRRKKDNAQLDNVMEILEAILESSGSVTLDLMDGSGTGPEYLQVETEAGLSVITLGEDDGEDFIVRTYTSNSSGSSKVTILGDDWDSKLICKDKNLVKEIFREFIKTGNVSRNLLS